VASAPKAASAVTFTASCGAPVWYRLVNEKLASPDSSSRLHTMELSEDSEKEVVSEPAAEG
jgi:hypothetical protein